MGLLFILGFTAALSLYAHNLKDNFQDSESPELPKEITIIATGDVMLGRAVMTTSLDHDNPKYPFEKVADKMQEADITFINLENPIVYDCPRHTDGFIFCADPRMVEGLTYAGVDIVSLANNHAFNYGEQGIEETKEILTAYGIEYTGLGNVVVQEIDGIRFGFLGFDKSQQEYPELTASEQELVIETNSNVDVLIVAMHWGVEYQSEALPGVRALAEKVVGLGADVIIGHHPHWVQNYETINDVPVYYSLGNFIFDQMWSEATRTGMAVKLTFQEDRLINDERMSVFMEEWAQPEWRN